MASPTMNDWRTFETVKNKDKAAVLYAYLCQGYNMVEVAQVALHDYNDMASQRVSNITRCYGFSGQNGGRYRKYDLSLADIEGFVKKHPDGCHDYRIMDEYVKKLAESRQRTQSQAPQQNRSNLVMQRSQTMQRNNTSQMDEAENSDTVFRDNIAVVIMAVLFIILKFFMSWGWIASIVVSFIIGALIDNFVRGKRN